MLSKNLKDADRRGKQRPTFIDQSTEYDNALYSSFVFVTLSLISTFLFFQIPQTIFQNQSKQTDSANQQTFNILLEQEKKQPQDPETEYKSYLSNQTLKARGNLTKEKGFENLSQSDTFLPMHPAFDARILHGYTDQAPLKTQTKKTVLPSHYKFRNKFAFSWDRFGAPQIPSIRYKHFEYFQAMLRKIRMHWAPPGGFPAEIYDDSFFSSSSFGGGLSIQSIRPQDVKVVFAVDAIGNVLGARIHDSIGDRIIDDACLDAIISSKNFGPPSADLLSDGIAEVSLIFRIGVY